MRVYFDNAATTALDERVFEAMKPYWFEHFGNPSSIHTHGRESKSAVERARKDVAEMLNTSPAEILFTSCGTESDNTAVFGAVRSLGRKKVLTSTPKA
jgi:cysteine desulfurase